MTPLSTSPLGINTLSPSHPWKLHHFLIPQQLHTPFHSANTHHHNGKTLSWYPSNYTPHLQHPSHAKKISKCQALGQGQTSDSEVFQGTFGPWTIEPSDVQEVLLYRSGLVTAAVSFVIASSAVFLPDNLAFSDLIKKNLDVFYVVGASGLGLSLYLIHIYVTEIKRTLQALWVIGGLGSLAIYVALAQPEGKHLVDYVVEHPAAVWFVGPLFASLTGLVFKEGLCYGKLEAGFLTFIIPTILLGHLSGLMDEGTKVTLLSIWMALFAVFAGRKFTQPIKDDIGDKSVFMFKALPEEEKNELVRKLERERS